MDQARERFLLDDFTTGFTGYLGMKALEAGEGRFVSRLELAPRHQQQDGFAHAGVCATIADHTAGYAGYTLVGPDRRILTIELKINYLKPAVGKALLCRARVISRGRTLLPAESEVYSIDEAGSEKLVAKAMVTLMSVPADSLTRPANPAARPN